MGSAGSSADEGSCLILTADEALELVGERVLAHPGPDGGVPRDSVNALPAADGRAVVVTTAGLFVFDPARAAAGAEPWSRVACELSQLLFFFKEAIHNLARHAQAARVEVELALEASGLRLAICDDGRGFDVRAPSSGQELASLRRRAGALGGELSIDSRIGAGTEIELVVRCERAPPSGPARAGIGCRTLLRAC